jgi:phospholipid N-methyltransferase
MASAYTYNGEITSITLSPSTIQGGDNITHTITVKNTGDDGLTIKFQVSGGDFFQTFSNITVPVNQTLTIQLITRAPVDSGQITFTYQLYWDKTSPDADILLDTETRSVYINQSAPSTGSLYITSNTSGASIYVDGSYRGITPVTLSGLTTGSHTVRILQSGYNDYSVTAIVYAGQTTTVSSTLIPSTPPPTQTGSIVITSSPSGADVYIDGLYRGITPVTLSGLTTGSHTVRILQSGYNDYSLTTLVYAGQTTTVSTALIISTPTPTQTGSIVITSSPTGADVYIDGSYRGISPVTLSGLTTGSHTVRILQSGYNDYSTNAKIYTRQTTTVTGFLSPITPVQTTSPAAAVPTTPIPQTTGSFDPSGLMILLIIGIVVVAGGYFGYSKIIRSQAEKPPSPPQTVGDLNTGAPSIIDDKPIKILKMRYAKGELTTEEYLEMIENLKK